MGSASSLPETQSYEVGPAATGEGAVRRREASTLAPRVTQLPTVCKYGAEIDTLYKLFANAAKGNPDGPCMGTRVPQANGKLGPFEYISFKTAHERILAVGSGIAKLGLPLQATFGLYGKNTKEWQICALGGFSQGLICVPVYDTLGDDIVKYEANHSEMAMMFVEASKLSDVAKVIKECKTLKHIVQIEDGVDEAMRTTFADADVTLRDYKTLMEEGTAAPVQPKPASGDGLAFVMYTSGTTGDPKGVCIGNLSIVVAASDCAGIALTNTDRYLSYLPLAHIFETMVEHAIWSVGRLVGFLFSTRSSHS